MRSANELADFMHYDLDEDGSGGLDTDSKDEHDGVVVERRQKIRHYLKPIEKVSNKKFEVFNILRAYT